MFRNEVRGANKAIHRCLAVDRVAFHVPRNEHEQIAQRPTGIRWQRARVCEADAAGALTRRVRGVDEERRPLREIGRRFNQVALDAVQKVRRRARRELRAQRHDLRRAESLADQRARRALDDHRVEQQRRKRKPVMKFVFLSSVDRSRTESTQTNKQTILKVTNFQIGKRQCEKSV